jgi:geranylgeranylglycerol-phosphate geranylgeranyltransferase
VGTSADLVVLVRLPSCIGGGVSVLLGGYLSTGEVFGGDGRVLLAGVGVALAVAVANVVNDVIDLDIDTFGKPERPLPAGRVSATHAWFLAAFLSLVSVCLVISYGVLAALGMAGLIGLAVSYSLWFKRTVLMGNIVVALCASVPVGYIAAITRAFNPSVIGAIVLTFLFMLSYETLKTRADLESDARSGIRTFATEWGAVASARLFRVLIALLTVIVLAAATVSSRPVLYLVAALTVCVFALGAALRIPGRENEAAIRPAVLLMRVAWFLGVGALWLLR